MQWTHDVIVVGAGAAGLTAAGGLARLGLAVALIEKGRMGGECLNTGCVPSKALIAAARRAHEIKDAGRFGIRTEMPTVDFEVVRAHIQAAIAAIAPHDSRERFEAWGVEVIAGAARFVGDRTFTVGDRQVSAPRVVLAVGSRPRIPSINGLENVPYLTNETLFNLTELPRRLLILGGGPIGIEMAQAFRRLGSDVLVIDHSRSLAREALDAASIVVAKLKREGVAFREDAEVTAVKEPVGEIRLTFRDGNSETGSHLLVAVGRHVAPNELNIAVGGVEADDTGIRVDRRCRTSARGVYAIGDCRQGPRFTHAAGYEGARVVTEIGFGVPSPVTYLALPRVTYTDPELAQVGLTEEEARTAGGRIDVQVADYAENDRAVVEGQTEGFIKTVTRNGRLVGTCIVGRDAGDLIVPWIFAIARTSVSVWHLSGAVLPYPTRSELTKQVAFARYERLIFSKITRGGAQALARFRRWANRRDLCVPKT
ncbi:MAG: FAD-dependent oxidoreductase [Nitrobacter sp.]